MRIYTKTGDKGKTSLVGGNKVDKFHPRVALYGDIDELNALVGLCQSSVECHPALKEALSTVLSDVQEQLFVIGSLVASEKEDREKMRLPDFEVSLIERLETQMDKLTESLPPLKNFVLPGGDLAASHLHLARTVTRRVERGLFQHQSHDPEDLPSPIFIFFNRLSDFFFVASRFCNITLEKAEVLWVPKT